MKLRNNTILITGGTSGIGLAIGRALIKQENTVILLGRNTTALAEAESEGFKTILCDLCNQEDIENTALFVQNNFSQINMLFNNACVQYNYLFSEGIIPLHKITQEINTNLSGQILLTQLLIPLLNNQQQSFIINTTSALGAFPKGDGLVYSASKAAMRNFTIGLRYHLKESTIRVLELIPPVTDTGMTKKRKGKKITTTTFINHILPQIEKEKTTITVSKIRLFLWIAFLFPTLANKLLSKQ